MEGHSHSRSVGAVFREFGKVISVPPNSTDRRRMPTKADDGSVDDEWMQAATGGERERLKNKHAGGRVGGNAERVGLRSPWRRWKRRMGGTEDIG